VIDDRRRHENSVIVESLSLLMNLNLPFLITF
jgi:hypothetical protein